MGHYVTRYKGDIPVHVKKIVAAISSSIEASKLGQSVASEIVNFVLSYANLSSSKETSLESWNNLHHSIQAIVTLAVKDGQEVRVNHIQKKTVTVQESSHKLHFPHVIVRWSIRRTHLV